MSLSKSKYWYSDNCLHFLKRVAPLSQKYDHNNTQYNDIQNNETQRNDTEHKNHVTQHDDTQHNNNNTTFNII
jgi:hypothetical protein